MIQLSASAIKNCLQPDNSHNWANKMMGFKPEDHDYYHQGNAAQDIIQKHITGELLNPSLMHLTEEIEGKKVPIHFPIMEERDFDPRCKFSFMIKPMEEKYTVKIGTVNFLNGSFDYKGNLMADNIREEYEIRGYVDGHDPVKGRICEIKSSSTPWTLGKFHSLMQRKVYALGFSNYKEFIGITCLRDPLLWSVEKPKMFRMPLTELDRREAFEWIMGAIKIIESGDYSGGLDENGKCTNPRCYYGKNCAFK
jgi:hypothetical protein